MAYPNIESYVQIIMLGGEVHDVSEDQWQMVFDERNKDWIECEDIYGSRCLIRPRAISSVRFWTKESGENYKAMHIGDED